ncbi:MAG: hypothetical protein PHU22_11650 [Eubacteriales bacterium]|nr:hypothetical protein [Eubacteriales bacterium]
MKKARAMAACMLLAIILSMTFLPCAVAEQKGEEALLRRALAESAEWKEYIITGETAGGAAIISNGKQNALAIYRNNELVVNLRAVYQPNEWLSEKARLEKNTDGFALL